MQGADPETVRALSIGDSSDEVISDKDRALLDLAHILTLRPAEVGDPDVDRARSAGWTDDQIAEAVYVISLFAFYNRVAHAFGLEGSDHGPEATPPSDENV